MTKEKLAKLINVKSIVTLLMTFALVAFLFTGLFTGIEPNKELLTLFCTSYGAVITYFFTHKSEPDTSAKTYPDDNTKF